MRIIIFALLMTIGNLLLAQCQNPNQECLNSFSAQKIELLVLYTMGALSDPKFGNGDNLIAQQKIQNLVDSFNIISENSGVVHTLNLVYSSSIEYVAEDSVHLDWRNLEDYEHEVLYKAHELRDDYGADLVGLIVENNATNTSLYGAANWPTCESGFIASRAFSAYTVNAIQPGIYSFMHEIGHNFGLWHDEETAENCDQEGVIDSIFCQDMFGHVSTNCGSNNANRWRTVMAKSCPHTGCARIPFWSNPNISHPITEEPLGIEGAANAAHGINIAGKFIADYKNGREHDSLQLVNLYTQMSGLNWTSQWDFAQPLEQWNGVLLENDRVVVLDLSSNNLSGTLPDLKMPFLEWVNFNNNLISGQLPDFNFLHSLEIFSINDNIITDTIPIWEESKNLIQLNLDNNNFERTIPDFSVYTDMELLYLKGNKYTFSDILPHFQANIDATDLYSYWPQQPVGEPDAIDIISDGDYTLCVDIDHELITNTYQWYKDTSLIATTNNNEYTLENLGVVDEGAYHCIITNSIITDLTLESSPVSINIYEELQPLPTWSEDFGGIYNDRGYDICLSNNGQEYIVCGEIISLEEENNYYVGKIDVGGGLIWENNFGGSKSERANSIIPSNDGLGYIVVGSSTSLDVVGNYGLGDILLYGISESGDSLWSKNYGGTNSDAPVKILPASNSDGYIVLGWTASDDIDVVGHHGGKDYWIFKIDNSGELQWSKALGGSLLDEPKDLVHAIEGDGYVVAGYTKSDDGDVPNTLGNTTDAWYFKVAENGDMVWQQKFNDSGSQRLASVITQNMDSDGYILAATAYGNIGIQSNNGVVYCAFETNAVGDVEWVKYFPTYNSINIHDICIANEQNGYIVAAVQLPFGQPWKIDETGNWIWSGSMGSECQAVIPNIAGDGYMIAGTSFNTSGSGDDNNIMVTQLGGAIPLPIELIFFTGTAFGEMNRLQWQVGEISNTEKFIIQKSIDGREWEDIGKVNIKDELQTYTFNDASPYINSYYRLSIEEANGQISYSNIINIKRDIDSSFSIGNIFPNPAADNISIAIENSTSSIFEIVIYNAFGEMVYEDKIENMVDESQIDISLKNFPNGVYTLSASNGVGQCYEKFIKQ